MSGSESARAVDVVNVVEKEGKKGRREREGEEEARKRCDQAENGNLCRCRLCRPW